MGGDLLQNAEDAAVREGRRESSVVKEGGASFAVREGERASSAVGCLP